MSDFICAKCGAVGGAKTYTKGTILVELFLWIFFIVPGLIYSLWRLCTRSKGCYLCGATDILPVNSPVGQKMMAAAKPEPEKIEPAAAEKTAPKQIENGDENDNGVPVFIIPA